MQKSKKLTIERDEEYVGIRIMEMELPGKKAADPKENGLTQIFFLVIVVAMESRSFPESSRHILPTIP